MDNRGKRQVNFELLRAVSMLLIVYHHFAVHSKFVSFVPEVESEDKKDDSPEQPVGPRDVSPNELFLYAISSGGKVGVNLFIMLSGYFLSGRSIKAASFIRTWIQTIIWSWLIFFTECGIRPMWKNDVIKGLFPVTSFAYWFITCFLAAVLLTPAIAKIILYTNAREIVSLIAVLFYELSIVPYTSNSYAYSHVMWYVYILIIGSTIRKYEHVLNHIPFRNLVISLSLALVANVIIIYVCLSYQFNWVNSHGGATFLMIDNYAPLALFISVTTFLLVSRCEVTSPIISNLASLTFGIYLIHDNEFIRPQLWRQIFQSHLYQFEWYFPIVATFTPLTAFLGCAGLEFIRQKMFGRLESYIVAKLTSGVTTIGETIGKRLDEYDDYVPISA